MRLIDADALWERLTGKSKYYDESPEDWSEIWDVIEGMPLVHPESKWIPVTERLPEVNDTYIVSYEDASVPMDWFNGHWFFYRTNPAVEETGTITAWQPFPERYKEEGGK